MLESDSAKPEITEYTEGAISIENEDKSVDNVEVCVGHWGHFTHCGHLGGCGYVDVRYEPGCRSSAPADERAISAYAVCCEAHDER